MTEFLSLWPRLNQWQKAKVALVILCFLGYNRLKLAGEDLSVFLFDWLYMRFVRRIINRNDRQLDAPHFTPEEIYDSAAVYYPELASSKKMK